MIIGNYQYKIDDKGRVKLPQEYREELGKTLIITLGIDDTLEIRSKLVFNEWLEKLLSKGSFTKELRKIHRSILGNSFQVDLDNQGRVKIPRSHLKILGSNQVQLLGVGDKVEIMSIENWTSFMEDTGSEILNSLVEENYDREDKD